MSETQPHDPSRIKYLTKAPIVEALLDFRFGGISISDIEQLTSVTLPFKEKLSFFQIRKQISGDESEVFPFTEQGDVRREIILSNEEDFSKSNRSIAIQTDGFIIRQTAPYTGWRDLYDAAKVTFDGYAAIAKPESVIRMASRYINKIDIPLGVFDFDDYFVFGPKVPGDVSRGVFDFHCRTGIQHDQYWSMKAWINQYIYRDPDNRVSMILDIDVFRTEAFPPVWCELENQLEEIHLMKNGLFFGSLTDAALRVYE